MKSNYNEYEVTNDNELLYLLGEENVFTWIEDRKCSITE